MSEVLVILPDRVSKEALHGMVEEFVTRDSTVWDKSMQAKRAHVLEEVKSGRAVIVFDPKTETTDIVPKESVRNLNSLST